jgi:hypothetical protein
LLQLGQYRLHLRRTHFTVTVSTVSISIMFLPPVILPDFTAADHAEFLNFRVQYPGSAVSENMIAVASPYF